MMTDDGAMAPKDQTASTGTGAEAKRAPQPADTGRPGPEPGRTRPDPTFPEAALAVVSWPDPVLDQLGHDPRSGYVERFWLPILGPSCLLLIRRMAAELERRPDGFTIESGDWARELGIGMKGGQHGPFWRAIERACRFGAARRTGPRLALRRRLPPLSSRQVQRLPPPLRLAHEEWASARLERRRRATVTQWMPRIDHDAGPGVEPGVGPASPEPTIEVDLDDAA